MRIFVITGLLACCALFSGGCHGMAYSQTERHALIARSWNIDSRQLVDDVDSFLMLRPPSRMSIWHVR